MNCLLLILRSKVRRAVALAGLGMLGLVPAVSAQTYDCDSLRQEMATAGRSDPQAAQFTRAAQRQRSELARTQAYAQQIGCDKGIFAIFSDDPPPQCDGIKAQIERMSSNLNVLEAQIEQHQGGDPQLQAALADQYRTTCSADPALADPYGDDSMRPAFGNGPDDTEPGEAEHRGGSKAICVRTCDGGFFPLGSARGGGDLAGLQSLCTALCPNTEAKLYTTSDTDNIAGAISIEGAAYTDLPAAYKFQKSFDAACACKPPGKSWVEALADAEKLLDRGSGHDVTVTAKMSDDMARPVATTPLPTKKTGKPGRRDLAEAQTGADAGLGALAAQAPTASQDSAGIANDVGGKDKVVRTGEGEVRTMLGPDGSTRRVRIIGPAL